MRYCRQSSLLEGLLGIAHPDSIYPLLLVPTPADWDIGPVPERIRRLQGEAERYWIALIRLEQSGRPEAAFARRTFEKGIRRLFTSKPTCSGLDARLSLERDDYVPVDLYQEAKWKLYGMGWIAFQVILWMWHVRKCSTHPNKFFRKRFVQLPPLTDRNHAVWWGEARLVHSVFFTHRFPQNRQILNDAAATKFRSEAEKVRYVNKTLRERIRTLAPKATSQARDSGPS